MSAMWPSAEITIDILAAHLDLQPSDVLEFVVAYFPESEEGPTAEGQSKLSLHQSLVIIGHIRKQLAEWAYEQDDFGPAAVHYEKVVDLFPEYFYVCRLAECLIENSQFERAEQTIREKYLSGRHLMPQSGNAAIYQLLCRALIQQEKWADAEEYLRQILEFSDNSDATSHLNTIHALCDCLMQQGKWSRAEDWLRPLISLESPNTKRLHDARHALAICLMNQQDYFHAELILLELSQLPNTETNPKIIEELERCRSELRKREAAVKVSQTKRAIEPIENACLVIFDLDGTLADTGSLEQGERTPARLLAPGLSPGDPASVSSKWAWSREVSDVPALLLERGHRVLIATNSPTPYASTLTHLIEVEHQGFYARCGGESGKSTVIKRTISDWGFQPSNVIYVGDTDSDAQIASSAGVRHMTAIQLLSGEILESLQTPLCGFDVTPKIDAGVDRVEVRKQLVGDENVPFYRSDLTVTSEERHLFEFFARVKEWTSSPRLDTCDFVPDVLDAAQTDSPLADYYRTLLFYTLRTHPGLPSRREIQEVLLWYSKIGERWDFQRAAVGDKFESVCFQPTIMTRREQSSGQIRSLFLSATAQMFPPIAHGHLSCVVNYWQDGLMGVLLKTVKDYRLNPKGSGPSVRLGILDGVADLCAAMMRLEPAIPIVPVPSSPFSTGQPGQFSLRLASAIGARVSKAITPLLEVVPSSASGPKQFRLRTDAKNLLPAGCTYDLFDDQITNGTTVNACRQVLDAAGYRLNRFYTYSAKPSNINSQRQKDNENNSSSSHHERWTHLLMRQSEPM
jgi:tetratricopeptide (TPR) repeat protein